MFETCSRGLLLQEAELNLHHYRSLSTCIYGGIYLRDLNSGKFILPYLRAEPKWAWKKWISSDNILPPQNTRIPSSRTPGSSVLKVTAQGACLRLAGGEVEYQPQASRTLRRQRYYQSSLHPWLHLRGKAEYPGKGKEEGDGAARRVTD